LDVTQFGGAYVDQPCVVDGNLISCRTWHDYNTPFMKVFLDQLRKVSAKRSGGTP
jgi:putative intracellular protease/amidase